MRRLVLVALALALVLVLLLVAVVAWLMLLAFSAGVKVGEEDMDCTPRPGFYVPRPWTDAKLSVRSL